ncbi:PREDICTED: uncharacterized protein LOC105556298 [Vollenhovia emeryi]|uniref:uncharacterized protein LOC105556298 n=1 Tax=Vollenhovia emeryi TaxID=411798 RepID=UPI0005F3C6C6|nr:PREDICTED: uncharacterized protein LOC105556298 [Vollenhovia emeryi]
MYRKLAEDSSIKYPIGSKLVLRDFYVDDLVTGADTLQDAFSIKEETYQLLQQGRFELCKWASNEPTLHGDSHHEKEFITSSNKICETRALGLVWKCASDQFSFSALAYPPHLSEQPKKYSVKNCIGIRSAWATWSYSKWKQYESELALLKDIVIPRRDITLDKPAVLELHGFADVSELAYGACIYLRTTDDNGMHSTHLICSKNRVAPLKCLSILRLELGAPLLLAQPVNKVVKGLDHSVKSICLWTDSTIVLAWLQSYSRSWTPFVANRVSEIQH